MSSRPCWAYTKKYSRRKNRTADSSCSHAPAWECYGGGKIMCGMDSHGGPWEPETKSILDCVMSISDPVNEWVTLHVMALAAL